METINFSKVTLEILKYKFGLRKTNNNELINHWFEKSKEYTLDDFENRFIDKYQKLLISKVELWNEFELSEHFLGPIMSMVDFNTDYFSMFAERTIEVQTENFLLTGKADMLVASGETEPINPYFCLQEYKRQTDPNGNPQFQVISEMYAASQKNKNAMPVYGISIIGKMWQFVVLQNSEYCLSYSFTADSVQLFEIYKILKALKDILIENAIKENSVKQ
jgi:hypothetical protein